MLQLKLALGAYMLATALLSGVAGCQHYLGAAHAATYYVAVAGNNSNPGTEEQPWRSVAYAASHIFAGDTIYVKNGTYIEEGIWIKRTGTASSPVKLLAYPGHSPVISFNDSVSLRKNLRLLIQDPTGHKKAMAWITIEGFVLKNGVNGIRWYNCQSCTVRRNLIQDPYGSGILGTGGIDNVIDRNVVDRAGSPEFGDHGLYLTGSRYIITNNLIYGSDKYGIQLKGNADPNDTVNYAGPEFAKSENAIISNNVIAYNRLAAGIVLWGTWANGARIENNIFYQNGQDAGTNNGITWITCCSTGVLIRNNISYATDPRPTNFIGTNATEGVHYTQSGNIINTLNPWFTNAPATLPALPDFRLNERSPAIDKGLRPEQSQGIPLTTTRIDLNGTPRPQGRAYDIGAYEYSAGGDSQSPAAPAALHVLDSQ